MPRQFPKGPLSLLDWRFLFCFYFSFFFLPGLSNGSSSSRVHWWVSTFRQTVVQGCKWGARENNERRSQRKEKGFYYYILFLALPGSQPNSRMEYTCTQTVVILYFFFFFIKKLNDLNSLLENLYIFMYLFFVFFFFFHTVIDFFFSFRMVPQTI